MLKNKKGLEKKMKRFRKLIALSLVIVGLLLASTAAKADTVLTLDSPFQIGSGPVFAFYGTITNTDANLSDPAVNLNGDGFPVLDSALTADDTGFWANTPATLAGLTNTGDVLLFTITAPAYGAGSNFYSVTYDIFGGADANANDLLASENFDVQVTPEPSSIFLMLTGMAGLAGTLRRRLIR